VDHVYVGVSSFIRVMSMRICYDRYGSSSRGRSTTSSGMMARYDTITA